VQVLGAGGGLGGPAHTDVNFGGKTSNLGAAPHDWGFAKKGNVPRSWSEGFARLKKRLSIAVGMKKRRRWLVLVPIHQGLRISANSHFHASLRYTYGHIQKCNTHTPWPALAVPAPRQALAPPALVHSSNAQMSTHQLHFIVGRHAARRNCPEETRGNVRDG